MMLCCLPESGVPTPPGTSCMAIERSARIAPKDFRDFTVQLHYEDTVTLGHLGNISETGLCIVLPAGVDFPPEKTLVEGFVMSRRLPTTLEFTGRVAWKARGDVQGEESLLAGIQFHKSVDLPDALMAVSISLDEPT